MHRGGGKKISRRRGVVGIYLPMYCLLLFWFRPAAAAGGEEETIIYTKCEKRKKSNESTRGWMKVSVGG